MNRGIVVLSLLALAASSVQAQVYRSVDEQGNVTFTDQASSGGEEVNVKPVTTVTLPDAEDVRQLEAQQEKPSVDDQTPAKPYSRVGFDAPEDDTAFHSGNGDMTFAVSSQPALRNGHLFEVSLDGQPIGQNASGQFALQNVFRGTHNASVNVIDRDGRIVQSGQSITFTIHRPSVLNRNRNN
ncbi:DUF4124 domain-containing protein [Marinobacter bohaiensis]|uniref:DUF4124 domain-containing protein n=1 Tax=Marinobacter bohaiensis TaxID=2201898 RepID=UPI000DADB39D|nr:DUF4124 domain-containing protein [Marinobacter bohaiensis]